MNVAAILPAAFSDLVPLVEEWALPTAAARSRKRIQHEDDLPCLKAAYDRMLPHIRPALLHLNGFALDRLPPPERRLFELVLMFAEIAHFVELRWRRFFGPLRVRETVSLPYSDRPGA